ncbi:peptidoglycan recognition family protein [Actinomadura sp. SCN-SB]|uniref:peptidoglycan recognition protein family protein n=1 Tax=Actinomadura sp. SCN-SB TaxID=3373092 RepID=UPI003751A240
MVSHAPRYIVIHHTSTPNVDDYSLARAELLARGIQNAHMNDQGWPDTGQHFTISRGGHILEGRHGSLTAARKGDFVIGTHAREANDYSVGIECEGTYNTVLPPRKLLSSLVRMCAWLCVQYDLDPQKAIVPHRKFNDTDCCGDKFAPTLPRFSNEVEKAVPKLLG